MMGIARVNIGETVWIYEEARYKNLCGEDRTARYVLGTKGKNPLVFFGINPSTAEPGNPDLTIKRVAAMTSNRGYDSWIMLNIYPQRATKPDDLDDDCTPQVHTKNIEAITHVIQNECPARCPIVAVWGNLIDKRNYLFACLQDIARTIRAINEEIQWQSFGETKKGNPYHPSRLKSGTRLQSFYMDSYADLQLDIDDIEMSELGNRMHSTFVEMDSIRVMKVARAYCLSEGWNQNGNINKYSLWDYLLNHAENKDASWILQTLIDLGVAKIGRPLKQWSSEQKNAMDIATGYIISAL
jgi:hypothetical protein